MQLKSRLRNVIAPWLRARPRLRSHVLDAERYVERLRHSTAAYLPQLIRPEPFRMEVAVTAACNLRCLGCRYGRDFMPQKQLPWPLVHELLDDAKEAGIWNVRFYGGEPLLHPDLVRMVEYSMKLDLRAYITTNGILLKNTITDLYQAGLRDLTIGFYGVGDQYDEYVQGNKRFARLEEGVATVRERYGMKVNLRMNWLLRRQTCTLKDLHAACAFAERYAMPIQVDLIHYSLPYFTEGPNRELQFRPEDRPAVEEVVAELVRLKMACPELLSQSLPALRSIPDWLMQGPNMRVPCDAYQMLWVGADGTVQVCYVTFKLGNLHEQRLSTMLFGPAHQSAARDSFALNCPTCHCHYDTRIQKHAPSMKRFS